jgi:V8-like Glu-specific endopeptidase
MLSIRKLWQRIFSAPPRPHKAVRRVHPRLEVLEDRFMPSAQPVGSTLAFPQSAVVRVTAYWDTNRNGIPDQGDYIKQGTGAMIGRHHALTAAHVIYHVVNPRTGTTRGADWVRIDPGAVGSNYRPFGSAWATQMQIWKLPDYPHDPTADIGVIRVQQPLGNQTGWFGFGSASLTSYRTNIQMIHYPGHDSSGRQWYSWGPVGWVSSTYFQYPSNRRTAPGSSGGPVFVTWMNSQGRTEWTIVGVHVGSYSNGTGEAARLTPDRVNRINNYIYNSPMGRSAANASFTTYVAATNSPWSNGSVTAFGSKA